MARVRFRVYLGEGHSVGPGKIQLLEAVRDLGSISAAARSMGMAYRHAWELIDDMNQCFRTPVVETASGGRSGGGARVTPFGESLVDRFHAMESAVGSAIAPDLDALDAEVDSSGRGRASTRARASGRATRRRARP